MIKFKVDYEGLPRLRSATFEIPYGRRVRRGGRRRIILNS